MKFIPKIRAWAPALCLLLTGVETEAQTEFPVGPQFQVNSYTPGFQAGPRVAAGNDGRFVVVYLSQGSADDDDSGYSVQGQLFSPQGSPIGAEIQVNTYTTSQQQWPAVAVAPDGELVVVWSSNGSAFSDNSGLSIQGQRFGTDGSRIGGEFEVNTNGAGDQEYPVAAMGDNGFVIVWASDGGGGGYASSIQARLFAANGVPLGPELAVSEGTTSGVESPEVARTEDGGFVVTWSSNESEGDDDSSTSVQARIFDDLGLPEGPAFQVNTYTTDRQFRPGVASAPGGGFAVVWTSFGSPGSDQDGPSIQSRVFDALGTPVGAQLQVNTYTTSFQVGAAVAALSDGGFAVVWESLGSAGGDVSDRSIQGRRLDAFGAPLGEPFQVNRFTTSYQLLPRVAGDGRGDFTVVWNSNGSPGDDSDSLSIQGQRFGPRIFADGFESGDTSAWTQAVSRDRPWS